MEQWKKLKSFPGYSVSDWGNVRNDRSGRMMSISLNQQGIPIVGLQRDREQHKRSVTVLVAHTWLSDPINHSFDTPINLDGDKTNNHVENLMWRPRWFAVNYQRQFREEKRQGFTVPIRDIRTHKVYKDAMTAAKTFGLLADEITKAIINRTYVFPTYQEFELVEE